MWAFMRRGVDLREVIITDVMCSSQEMAIDIGYRAISNATFKKGSVRDSSIFFCIKVRR